MGVADAWAKAGLRALLIGQGRPSLEWTVTLPDSQPVDGLRRFGRGEAFDEQPMPGLDSEALDFRVASESFAGVRRLTRRDLETLRLVTDQQGLKVPTVGAMLLLRELGTGPQDPKRRYVRTR
jgi:hypothetical protein